MQFARRTLLAALAIPGVARAQSDYPSRQVRIVVPFPAGGGLDALARALAERLQAQWRQPVVVDNRPGATGAIGSRHVAQSPADGHTLLVAASGTLTINPHLYANMGFNPATDLAGISMAFATDHVLVVNPAVPAQTAQEFIALLKARPGQLSFGSGGNGSSTHLVPELFKLVAQVDMQHVPYRGSAPALNDLVAGNVQVMLDQLPSALPMIQGGRVRALAVTGPRRSRLLPDLPTMAELGLPQAEATSWGAVMVPAGTPAPAIARLNAVIREALAEPGVQQRLAAAGADAVVSTPAELAGIMRSETEKWGRVVREARVTVN